MRGCVIRRGDPHIIGERCYRLDASVSPVERQTTGPDDTQSSGAVLSSRLGSAVEASTSDGRSEPRLREMTVAVPELHGRHSSRCRPPKDFEPGWFECVSCGIEDRDLAEIAESRPWEIGARAVLPDGIEAHIQAIGRDRTMGKHREPTAICRGATDLLRDLRRIKPVHPDQLALPV